MRASLLKDTITARAKAHFDGVRIAPAMIQGPPGVGKTQLLQSCARDQNVGLKFFHGPTMLDQDFGMPWVVDGELVFQTPGHKFPFVDSDCPEFGYIVVDEAPQMDNSQQKIWANIVQERELHGRKLKPGWYVVMTGNRLQDRAGASRILSHFNDRFTTYEFEASLDDWCSWALTEGNVNPIVVGYLRWKPGNLLAFDPNKEKFPTPRGWAERVSPILDIVPPSALFDTIKGDVGEGCAAEFLGFVETYRSLPNPDLVIAQPDTHPVPTETNVLFALSGALAHRANADNFGSIIKFAERMPQEFMVLLVRDATKVNPALCNTDTYIRWCAGPGARILLNQ